jgi:hypothetical protein
MSFINGRYGDRALVGTLPSASLVKATAAASTSTGTTNEPSSSSSSSSSSPYNSLVAILGQRTGMSAIQAERAVGFSAITGTSLLAMRVAMYAYRSLLGDDKNDDETSDSSTVISKEVVTKQTRTAGYSILGIFRRTLRRILLDESEYIARAPPTIADDTADAKDGSEGPLVTHQGSCHCESIQFTVLAPNVLHAQDGPGKIQFRHAQVKASNFRVYAGFENLKTYYVAYRDSGNKGAHAFCERCGVHVLYAPSKSTPYVSINVRCLRDDKNRKIKLTSKKDGISGGIPVAGQFDNANSDHLSTISEVTQPFHFQMNFAHQNPANFGYPSKNHLLPRPSRIARKDSDVSSMASPVTSDDGGLEVPIKQFYTTNSQAQKNRRSTFSTATASLTEADSSGSIYRGQISGPDLLPPMSPPRSGGATFGGFDDFSFTGESVSLIDDNMSLSSAQQSRSGTISIRGNKHALRVNTGRENDMVAGNPPLHPTVTSPETRNKMKYFMSKYKKNANN